MNGKKIITRCPYCNQIITKKIGITKYYKYRNKSVCIDEHCNKKFITEYQSDQSTSIYSEPLTNRIKKELIADTVICW